ncbi:MAG TPA: hypothetical protein VFL86_22380 [Burkholderiaceae bacterium]|nr:hypothetical protein [Burkholderiaceae bacterium]
MDRPFADAKDLGELLNAESQAVLLDHDHLLDENDCPVILEYKHAVGENVINQGLF